MFRNESETDDYSFFMFFIFSSQCWKGTATSPNFPLVAARMAVVSIYRLLLFFVMYDFD